MADPVKVKACPFCGGPPVPFVANDSAARGPAPLKDTYDIEADGLGLAVRAAVFCHECGAEGPHADAYLEVRADYFAVEAKAVELWNLRDERHREGYDAGDERGLNLYPRPDEAHLYPDEAPRG